MTDSEAIRKQCRYLEELLLKKNVQYGSSVFDPVRVFSKAGPEEQIKVRMDDKLSRLARGDDSIEADDDVLRDLAGYCILLLALRELNGK